MTVAELRERIRGWRAGEYAAVVFEKGGEPVAYALYRETETEVYLRQMFVTRGRRREGIGREAMKILRERLWQRDKRLTVEILTKNAAGIAFWRAVGYQDYCLTLEIMPEKCAGTDWSRAR